MFSKRCQNQRKVKDRKVKKRPEHLTEMREQISSAVMHPQLGAFFQWCFWYGNRVGMSWKNTIGNPWMSLTWFWWGRGGKRWIRKTTLFIHILVIVNEAKGQRGPRKKKQWQQRNEPQGSGSERCSEAYMLGREIGCLHVNIVLGIETSSGAT